MAEKMCKVSDLEARYSYKSLAPWKNEIGGGVNKCLKVKDFLQYFEKTNYELSVPNRNEMRLFPSSSIKEYYSPFIIFKNDSLIFDDTVVSSINPFTAMNIQYLTVTASNSTVISSVSIENTGSTTSSDGTLQITGDIMFNIVKNTSTTLTKSATITLSGTRTDYGGNVSKSFSITLDKATLYANVKGTDIPINIPHNGSKQVNIESNTSWTASLTSNSNYDFGNGLKSKSSGGNGFLTIYNTGGSLIASNDDTLTIRYGNNKQNTYRVKLIGT